ncbi:hypothetical protein HHI36_017330 [Cryptolaemus montrouzieri]|uniref:Peptidase S1 domain-containing protein n=1 Tax=Cryptolaemus montrouzieri TaxID=559131 RepID=A0ABD2NML0_9CUCU
MFGKIVFFIAFRFICVQSDSVKPQLKIIGGDSVRNRSDFPYQVSLRLKGSHFCGGAIIDHSFIITAAHCCFNDQEKPWTLKYLNVVAGDLNIRNHLTNTSTRGVKKVFWHSDYHSKEIENDIAIWEVSSPFVWTKHIQPIAIANESVKSNTLCNVSGWGVTQYERNTIENTLQFIEIPVNSKSSCRKIYPEVDYLHVLCAGSPGKDSCQGDSGGPLVCKGHLTGIVSYGINCGIFPGIYTDVYHYRSWIRSKVRMSLGSKLNTNLTLIISILIFSIVLNL